MGPSTKMPAGAVLASAKSCGVKERTTRGSSDSPKSARKRWRDFGRLAEPRRRSMIHRLRGGNAWQPPTHRQPPKLRRNSAATVLAPAGKGCGECARSETPDAEGPPLVAP